MKSFFSLGLRPFFTATALCGILVPMYLVCVLYNNYPFPGEILGVIGWHGHELLFGMVPALLSGFLLTASANWTNTRPLQKIPLALFFLLWLITRIVFFFFQRSPQQLLFIGPIFLIVLQGLMIFKLRGNRNFYLINGLIFLMTIAQVFYLYGHLFSNLTFHNIGIKTVSLASFYLLFVFSGRLIPFFTNNRFKQELIVQNKKLEIVIFILSTVYFILEFITAQESTQISVLAFIISSLLFYRSWSFYNRQIWREPMVFCLHLAHLWMGIFFALKGFEQILPNYVVGRPALHALYVGAVGMFGVSIMGRASLGHTGRPIAASRLMLVVFGCIYVGALLRVFGPLVFQDMSAVLAHSSMGVWVLGLILFLVKFIVIYLTPRPDLKLNH